MSTVASQHTFADLLKSSSDGPLMELVRGELVEKPIAFLALWVATRIARLLSEQLEDAGLGWVATEVPIDCFDWIPRHGRRPDVAYFRKESLQDGIPTDDPITIAPDLCVEVVSIGDGARELDAKVEEYLQAGVKLVWCVYPETRTVKIFRFDGSTRRCKESDAIENEPALPNFRALVADFFPKKPA